MSKDFVRRTSISLSAAIFLVTVSTGILCVFGVLKQVTERRGQWKELEDTLSIEADELSTSLALPAWNVDEAQIRRVIESKMREQSVAGVRVEANEKSFSLGRASNWNSVETANFVPNGDLLKETRRITFSGHDIGSVDLYVTPKFVLKKLQKNVIDFVILIGALEVSLVLILYFVLWTYVLSPLQQLKKYASGVSEGNLTSFSGGRFSGELQTLRISIEEMVSQLRDRITQIEHSKDRYQTLFSVDPDALFLIDNKTLKLVDINDSTAALYGYTREQMVGLSLLDISAETEKTKAAFSNNRLGEIQNIEERIHKKKDGSTFPVSIASRSCILDGKLVTISTVRDKTQQLRAEKLLQDAKEKAESADKMKSEFLDIAAHELKTPLTSIRLLLEMAQILLNSQKPVPKEHWERMASQVERLKVLVNDLLEVNRLESGQFTVRPSRVRLDELISRRLQDFQDQAPNRCFHLKFPENPVEAELDPLRIDQVISNFLENALKYTPENSPIELKLEHQPTGHLQVSVKDHGNGIPKASQVGLFSRFYRIKSESTARHSGLGLGLYICRKIIEAHGGHIGVESEEGHGSIFYFDLPPTQESQ